MRPSGEHHRGARAEDATGPRDAEPAGPHVVVGVQSVEQCAVASRAFVGESDENSRRIVLSELSVGRTYDPRRSTCCASFKCSVGCRSNDCLLMTTVADLQQTAMSLPNPERDTSHRRRDSPEPRSTVHGRVTHVATSEIVFHSIQYMRGVRTRLHARRHLDI